MALRETFYICIIAIQLLHLRWLNRVTQDHETRASDLNRK